jgi:hypothetical protein
MKSLMPRKKQIWQRGIEAPQVEGPVRRQRCQTWTVPWLILDGVRLYSLVCSPRGSYETVDVFSIIILLLIVRPRLDLGD